MFLQVTVLTSSSSSLMNVSLKLSLQSTSNSFFISSISNIVWGFVERARLNDEIDGRVFAVLLKSNGKKGKERLEKV